jgi:hypothetical protein
MEHAAANYASYLDGEHSWMLGVFVAPAARLAELQPLIPEKQRLWRVAVLAGEGDAGRVAEFQASGAGVVPWAEVKGTSRMGLPPALGLYHEISGPESIPQVKLANGRAKFRTGAVSAEGFPAAETLARSIAAAVEAQVPFKCTAGLHHAIRSEYRLTYKPDSARATMHGFLNVLVASVLAQGGASVPELVAVLEESSPEAFGFNEGGLSWNGRRASNGQIRRARETGMISFGSCSFVEPVEELQALGLL